MTFALHPLSASVTIKLISPALQLACSFTPNEASGKQSAACLSLANFKGSYNFKLEFTLTLGTKQLAIGLTGLMEPGFRERKPSTN